MRSGLVVLFVFLVAGMSVIAVGGCGSSASNTVSREQLEAARAEGEEKARERGRVNHLQHQVHGLKRRIDHSEDAASAPAVGEESSDGGQSVPVRAFHAPSGNVSCEILSDGALCTVVSAGVTFSFGGGEVAEVLSTTSLPASAGELAPYGSTISAGSVSCIIPSADDPHGVICVDGVSGHGFEASRVVSRQRAY